MTRLRNESLLTRHLALIGRGLGSKSFTLSALEPFTHIALCWHPETLFALLRFSNWRWLQSGGPCHDLHTREGWSLARSPPVLGPDLTATHYAVWWHASAASPKTLGFLCWPRSQPSSATAKPGNEAPQHPRSRPPRECRFGKCSLRLRGLVPGQRPVSGAGEVIAVFVLQSRVSSLNSRRNGKVRLSAGGASDPSRISGRYVGRQRWSTLHKAQSRRSICKGRQWGVSRGVSHGS